MAGACPTRRRFLELVAAGAVAALDVGCGGPGAAAPQAFGDVSAGNVSDLPVGTLRAVPGQPVAAGRDAQGLYALTLTCTHAGCDMGSQGSVSYASIYCACHGSQFDHDGNVTQGPASAPLVHFQVTVDTGGNITVHGGQEVDASTRVAV